VALIKEPQEWQTGADGVSWGMLQQTPDCGEARTAPGLVLV